MSSPGPQRRAANGGCSGVQLEPTVGPRPGLVQGFWCLPALDIHPRASTLGRWTQWLDLVLRRLCLMRGVGGSLVWKVLSGP